MGRGTGGERAFVITVLRHGTVCLLLAKNGHLWLPAGVNFSLDRLFSVVRTVLLAFYAAMQYLRFFGFRRRSIILSSVVDPFRSSNTQHIIEVPINQSPSKKDGRCQGNYYSGRRYDLSADRRQSVDALSVESCRVVAAARSRCCRYLSSVGVWIVRAM